MKRIEALYTKDLSDFLHSLKQQEAIKMLGLNYKTFCGWLLSVNTLCTHSTNMNYVHTNLKHKCITIAVFT